ncbi:asparagine synthetase domain-containing protein 1 [Petromyzon marinus]|uniref:asparagine synthetase domain-containing protein 1 n=1 Tax=Petromyzon marinus TaxID=7757 RepID=UPI003F7293C7
MCGIFCAVVPHDPAIPRPDPLPDRLTRDLLEGRGPDLGGQLTVVATPDDAGAGTGASFELRFLARVLHLRGDSPEPQPAVDARGNVLLWNGEVFGGLEVPPGESDTSVVLRALAGDGGDSGSDGVDSAIVSTLSLVRGPWALLYYQRASRCLWFGRDCFGRRSLLWLFPEAGDAGDGGGSGGGGGTVDPRWFAISSVASQQVPAGARWSEVPADGVYKVHLGSGGSGGSCLHVEWFPWRWSPPELAPPSGVDGAARTTPDTQDDSCHCHSGSPLDTTPRPLGGTRGETPTEEDGRAEELPPFFCVTKSKAYPGLRSFVPPMNMSVPQSPSAHPQGPHPQAPHPQSPHPQDPHPQGPHPHGPGPLGPDVISERMVAARQLVEALDEAVRVRCIPENCGGGSGSSGAGEGGVGVGDGSTDDGGGAGNAGGSTSGYGGNGGSIAGEASVAVLFSGGLDCMVLAALAHRHVPAHEPIDLLNVAFECRRRPLGGAVASGIGRRHRGHGKNSRKPAGARKGDPPKRGAPAAQVAKDERSNGDGSAAPPAESGAGEEEMEIGGRDGGPFDVPDRLSARAGLEELRTLFPHRRWRLLGVDVRADELASARARRIAHLVHPARSVLDDALGCALWFAARGRGELLLDEGDWEGTPPSEPGSPPPGSTTAAAAVTMPAGPELFVSRAKVLLSGLGADEQLAGYSRHAARFRQGGWSALAAELRAELGRIGRRNLGRDDRVTADHGKEARFPYLDEAVVSQLSALPAHVKAEPGAARGTGDKLLLRQAALVHLGLAEASARPKRALQFGSRIAHMEGGGGGSGGGPRERGSDSCSRLVQQHHPSPECV